MKDILEELYCGEVRPFETTLPRCQEYEELQEKIREKECNFEKKLDKLDPALRSEYIKLTEAQNAAYYYEDYQNFAVGFRLGVRITAAVFTGR